MGNDGSPGVTVLGSPGKLPFPGQGLRRMSLRVDPDSIKTYDFRRPDKFSKEQVRTLQIIHEGFGQMAMTSLSTALRSVVQVSVASVDQECYGEFVQALPHTCSMAILAMDPLKGSALLEFDNDLVFAMLDRLFGGRGEASALRREISDIEFHVIEGILAQVAARLREAWSPVMDLKPRLCQVEEMPQFAQIVPPSEMVAIVAFEAKVGEVRAAMRLCLPYLTIEPVIPRLTAQEMYGMMVDRSQGPDMRRLVASVGTEVEVSYEGARLSLAELSSLRPGCLVELSGYGQGRAELRSGATLLSRLRLKPERGSSRPSYEVLDRRDGGAWLLSGKAEKAPGSSLEERFSAAFENLSRRLAESQELLEGKLSEGLAALGRKQDELADQLAFSPDGPVAAPAMEKPGQEKAFAWIQRVENKLLADFLGQELPQLIALVLSHLEAHKAAAILGLLGPEAQPQVARKLALMDQVSPETLAKVDEVLRRKLTKLADEAIPSGGVEALVAILGMADRSTERNIVEALEKADPDVAEEIKKRLFVFEDIVLLDRKAATKVLARIDTELLIRALKGASDEVRELAWSCLPAAEVAAVKQRYEELGSVRLSEADGAQQKIVSVITELEDSGEIMIRRPEEGGG